MGRQRGLNQARFGRGYGEHYPALTSKKFRQDRQAQSVVLSGQSRHEYASLATALKRRAHGTGVKRRAEFVEHGVNARHGQCHLREITLVGLPPSAEQVRGTDK